MEQLYILQGQKNSNLALALIWHQFLSETAFLFYHFWLSSVSERWPGGLQHLKTSQIPSHWDAVPREMFFSLRTQRDSSNHNLVCSLEITLQGCFTGFVSFGTAWKQFSGINKDSQSFSILSHGGRLRWSWWTSWRRNSRSVDHVGGMAAPVPPLWTCKWEVSGIFLRQK